jgi:hypothetical protein
MSAWIARANDLLGRLRALLRPYGLEPSTGLRIVADTHPCPGYVHETETIQFCPPEIAGPVDRLRWSLFVRVMGCESFDEARAFYDVALPFIVAHETAHHLRTRRGLDAGSPFVEEQACDRLAAAFVEAQPDLRGTLVELQRRCARMGARLAAEYRERPTTAFVPDAIELAVREPEGHARLSALRRLGASAHERVEQWLAILPEADGLAEAEARRLRAGGHLDLHYTRDPAEYWYASVVWLDRYLARDDRPTLIAALNTHLLCETLDDERLLALCDTLVHDDPVLVEGAASALLDAWGGAIAHDLVDRALERPSAFAPITRALARARSSLPPGAVARLWPHGEDADVPRLLRLMVRSRAHDETLRSRARVLGPTSPAIAAALTVLDGGDVAAALADPARCSAALDLLEDMGASGPWVAAASLPRPGSETWERLLARSARVGPANTPVERLRAMRFRADATVAATAPPDDVAATAPPDDVAATAPPDDVERVARLGEAWLSMRPRGDDPGARFARDALAQFARRQGLELVLLHVPARARVAAAKLAELVERVPELEPALADLLAAHVCDPSLRARVRALLLGEAPRVPAAPVAPTFSPLAVALGYVDEPAVRSLLDKIIHLRTVPLFAALAPEQLAELASLSIERRHDAGELVVREGDRGDELHLLLEGTIGIERSGVSVAELTPPGFFGEMSLFDGAPRSATAVARTACRLLTLDGEAVRRAGRRDPAIFEALLAELSRRLRALPVTRRDR